MKEVSVIPCKTEERKLACECYLIKMDWTCGNSTFYAYSNTWDNSKIRVTDKQSNNQEWTMQRHMQHWAHKDED